MPMPHTQATAKLENVRLYVAGMVDVNVEAADDAALEFLDGQMQQIETVLLGIRSNLDGVRSQRAATAALEGAGNPNL